MSDTPRTDEMFEMYRLLPGNRECYLEWSRQLERELNEAKAEIERLQCCLGMFGAD